MNWDDYDRLLRRVTKCAWGDSDAAAQAIAEAALEAQRDGWLDASDDCRERLFLLACRRAKRLARNKWKKEANRRRLLGERHESWHLAYLDASAVNPAERCDEATASLARFGSCLQNLHPTNYKPAVFDLLVEKGVVPDGCEHVMASYDITPAIIEDWKLRRSQQERTSDRCRGSQRLCNCVAKRPGPLTTLSTPGNFS